MAEVYIAAAPGDEPLARGLAEALNALGCDVAAGAPGEADIAKLAEESKAILALWPRQADSATWLTALGVLAQERRKLICVELTAGRTPALFKTAPTIDLALRQRADFKTRFTALVAEIDKLAEKKADTEKLPDILAKTRLALLNPPGTKRKPYAAWGAIAAGVALLFAVGFGAGRIVNAIRSGDFLVASNTANAAPASAALEQRPAGFTQADLQRRAWREIAASIDAETGERIKAEAREGEPLAQALACIAHMGGAPGFLPSPAAAREQCDAGAAQDNPAALYFSWVLHRAAPHAGIDQATARGRLARAAQLGWTPAIIDYALTLPNDQASQAQAGRLFLAAAERDDPRGQFQYARWLRDSSAGPRNPTAAIPFLERAANHGQPEALHMLATFHRDGIGVAINPTRAKALYDRAAQQEHPPSMFNLADMLRSGSQSERARAITLYQALACMRDERQIAPMAQARLRALQASASCR